MRAIITGAASGIGRAAAARIAKDALSRTGKPARLFLMDLSSEGLASIQKELSLGGTVVDTFVGDLADPNVPAEALSKAQAALGGLDALVSNAGIVTSGVLNDLTLADFDRSFAVNARATWLLAKAAYPLLKESKGCLVATASLAAEVMTPALGAYSASKAAVLMLVRQLACEWASDGIRCNCVSPGAIETAMNRDVFKDRARAAARAARIPLRRVGHADELAAAISFLLSSDASYISGTNLIVDGGMQVGLMAAFREPPRGSEESA